LNAFLEFEIARFPVPWKLSRNKRLPDTDLLMQ
jgi:hypothetical protein